MHNLVRQAPRLAVLSFVLLAPILSPPALAQTQASNSPSDTQNSDTTQAATQLGEVIVTAEKRSEHLINVPADVTLVSGNEIDAQGIPNLLDLSYRVPGLVVQQQGPGTVNYTMNGIGNTVGTSSLVGVYLDEFDFTSQGQRAQSGPSQFDLGLYDLNRVEVLHGPQGTLWGAGSVGGTIHFVTNAPDLSAFGVKGQLETFMQSEGAGSAEADGVINLPVVAGVLGMRIVGTRQDFGGWIDQPAAGRLNFNDDKTSNVRIRTLWQPTQQFDVDATVMLHRSNGGGQDIANISPLSAHQYQSFLDPTLATPFDDDYNFYGLTLHYNFSTVSLLSATGYTDADHYEWTARQSLFAIDLIPLVPDTNNVDGYGWTDTRSRIFTEELRAASSGNGNLQWISGVLYRSENDPYFQVSTVNLGPVPLASNTAYDDRSKSKSLSVYADSTYAITSRWKLGAGARYFTNTEDFAATTPPVSSQSATFHNVSPRAYIEFVPIRDVNLYASVAQGFRSGGFNSSQAVSGGGAQTYAPEHVTTYEIGWKASLAGGRAYLELTPFYSNYTDMQATGILPSVLANVVSNIGRATIRGVDYSVDWRPFPALTLGLEGSWLHTEVVRLSATQTQEAVGDPLSLVSDYNYSVTADYHFHWLSPIPGFVHVDFSQQGPVYYIARSSFLLYPVGKSDTLRFLDANVGATWNRMTFELFGRNLLNESGANSPYGGCCFTQTQPRPRQIGVRVAYDGL